MNALKQAQNQSYQQSHRKLDEDLKRPVGKPKSLVARQQRLLRLSKNSNKRLNSLKKKLEKRTGETIFPYNIAEAGLMLLEKAGESELLDVLEKSRLGK